MKKIKYVRFCSLNTTELEKNNDDDVDNNRLCWRALHPNAKKKTNRLWISHY